MPGERRGRLAERGRASGRPRHGLVPAATRASRAEGGMHARSKSFNCSRCCASSEHLPFCVSFAISAGRSVGRSLRRRFPVSYSAATQRGERILTDEWLRFVLVALGRLYIVACSTSVRLRAALLEFIAASTQRGMSVELSSGTLIEN